MKLKKSALLTTSWGLKIAFVVTIDSIIIPIMSYRTTEHNYVVGSGNIRRNGMATIHSNILINFIIQLLMYNDGAIPNDFATPS